MLNGLLGVIAEAGEAGAPEGPMYAALMGRMNLDQFGAIMEMLDRAGLITRRNHLVTATSKLVDAYTKARAR